MKIAGKSVVITGAGSGIGAALARCVAGKGAQVFVADLDGAAAASVAEEIGGHSTVCDVRDETAVQAMIA